MQTFFSKAIEKHSKHQGKFWCELSEEESIIKLEGR